MTASTTRLRAALAALTLVAGFGALAATAAPADAAATTRYVATNGDDTENDCTNSAKPCQHVQYAVDQAAAGDTVQVAKGQYAESVDIRIPLTVQGAGSTGANKTVISGGSSGNASIRLNGLDVNQTVEVTVKDVAVDGNTDNDGIQAEGDAILHLVDSTASSNNDNGVTIGSPATATVDNSTVDNNGQAGINTFGLRALQTKKPAKAPAAQVTVSGSDISNNNRDGISVAGITATVDHSTINRNGDGGVVVYTDGTADVSTSTMDANIGAGFVLTVAATTNGTLTDSTVSNTKPFSSGGEGPPIAFGGGVLNLGGTLQVSDSTIVANTGQGVLTTTATTGDTPLVAVTKVDNSTINGTTASVDSLPSGGIVFTNQISPGVRGAARTAGSARTTFGARVLKSRAAAPATSSVTVQGTIVADQASTKVPDCDGTVTDGGYNLSSDASNSCKFTAAQHDQVSTDPLLGPLADNGGPTMTELLKKLSPAIDAIPAGAANCTTSATDQRGVARPQPTGGKCDVGAVELAAKPLAIHPDSLPHGKVGKAYHATITATGGQYPTYTFAFVSGTLPDGLTFNSHGKISGTPTKAGTFHFTVSVNDPVLKAYTIVITDAGSGTAPVSNTGVHTGSMLAIGGGAVAAGILLLLWVGVLDRKARGPRMVYGRHHKS